MWVTCAGHVRGSRGVEWVTRVTCAGHERHTRPARALPANTARSASCSRPGAKRQRRSTHSCRKQPGSSSDSRPAGAGDVSSTCRRAASGLARAES